MSVAVSSIVPQAGRFLVVGLATNATLFLVYALLTQWLLGPKFAMTITYGMGVALSFIFNRAWTFRSKEQPLAAFARYCSLYMFGYVLNLVALWLMVDYLSFPHLAVQAVMIVLLAMFFFLAQRHWVFQKTSTGPIAGGESQ